MLLWWFLVKTVFFSNRLAVSRLGFDSDFLQAVDSDFLQAVDSDFLQAVDSDFLQAVDSES
jgi:hypothetical protein